MDGRGVYGIRVDVDSSVLVHWMRYRGGCGIGVDVDISSEAFSGCHSYPITLAFAVTTGAFYHPEYGTQSNEDPLLGDGLATCVIF
jgi:hypothetical protein